MGDLLDPSMYVLRTSPRAEEREVLNDALIAAAEEVDEELLALDVSEVFKSSDDGRAGCE